MVAGFPLCVLSDSRNGAATDDAQQVRVSIIIPAYKAETTIEDTIAALASQTFHAFEVIVVDDASPDSTGERACRALRRSGLRHVVVRLVNNAGPSSARNAGVSLASGEYVAFQDADDTWMPEKLARQVELMDGHPEVTLCGCQADLVAANGAVIGPLFLRLPAFQTMGWRRLLSNAFIQTSCALVRRADLGTQPFDPTLRIAEDRDLWIRLASNGVTALLQDVLVRKAELPTSFMSTNTMLIALDTKRMVDYHVSAMRDYMNWRERRLIYGSLHSSIGKGLSPHSGHYLRGVRHLLMAIGMGYNMTDNVRFLILSNPAVRTLRHRLGLLRANAG